jgi:hypothetical protein
MSHLDMVGPLSHGPADTQLPIEVIIPQPRAKRGSSSDDVKSKLHITCQFWHGKTMVYELKAGPRRIEVRIRPSTTPEGWSVEMLVRSDDKEHSDDVVGRTRLSAFEALEGTFGDILGGAEWMDLREALANVRAL